MFGSYFQTKNDAKLSKIGQKQLNYSKGPVRPQRSLKFFPKKLIFSFLRTVEIHRLSFKAIPHTLVFNALKKFGNYPDKKVGLAYSLKHSTKNVGTIEALYFL